MPGPRLPIEASDVSRPADFTAAPQNHALAVLSPIKPLQGVVVARRPDQLTAPASLAVPLNLAGAGIRLSSPPIVLPSYFSVMLASALETPSAAVVRKRSLFNFSPAE